MTNSDIRKFAGWVLLALAIVQFLATSISLYPTNRGIVRLLDFVREPSIYISGLLVVLALFVARPVRWFVIAIAVLSAVINLFRMWPYTMLAGSQVPLPEDVDGMSCVKVMAFNVLQTNDRYGDVAAMIERVDPDVLLLMETNGTWIDALEPQLARYAYRLTEPLDNKYGMAFATRLQVERATMVANTSSNTPTLYATMRVGDGARFEMIGLHPRPPLPGESTQKRDENIARAGTQTPDRLDNVLAMGDFNDVPWSRTTQNFVHEGGFSDPRAGRGSYPTFPAGKTWVGWPLDQLFVKNGVKVESFERLEANGSDHLPMLANVCVGPEFDNSADMQFVPATDAQ